MAKTFFLRLEPRTTSSDLSEGIAARIYDPLWTLGRQWQLGELLGDDAGSPVTATLDSEAAMLSVYGAAGAPVNRPYDPNALPLDVLVEADPVRSSGFWTIRMRIDAGRAFLRALDDYQVGRYSGSYVRDYAFEHVALDARAGDPAVARLLDLAVGRIPDGGMLFEEVIAARRAGNSIPLRPVVETNDTNNVRDAVDAWLAWCSDVLFETEEPSAWRADTLDYGFSVATSTNIHAATLDSSDQRGGALDWYSFDMRPGATPADFQTQPTVTVLPTAARFRGMPNTRWWEFEDASIDFGSVDAGASDSARLALLEFGLLYANDFFVIPLRLAVGSLCRIKSLVVADTFGMHLKINAAAHGSSRQSANNWSMFTLSERDPTQRGSRGVADLFFLPPVAQQVVADRPVEEVLLLRDEMANLAWAVERRYEGGRGIATERIEEGQRGRAEALPADAEAQLRYLLGSTVPPYWFPLVPLQGSDHPRFELQRMANQPTTVNPLGRFLDLQGPSIVDAAIPREGRQLLRDYAYTRWVNGVVYVWSRRRSRIGRGEGSSNLRFDIAEPESDKET